MITIKKSSLLGRYYGWLMRYFSGLFDFWKDLSLCLFVQRIFWKSLLLIEVISFGAFLFLSTIFIAIIPFLSLFFYIDSEIVMGSGVLWLLILIFYCFHLKRKYGKKMPEKSTKSSIIIEWVKAKKAKICPLIKVED